MTLTDAERLILINQYKILQALLPKDYEEDYLRYGNALEELQLGIHEGELNFNIEPRLGDAVPRERVHFAIEVCEMFEERKLPFYGFRDERLNKVSKYWGTPIKKGTPPSDDEYRAMLAKEAA
jgi:uncharacterized protein YfbU (UPF0304 family)